MIEFAEGETFGMLFEYSEDDVQMPFPKDFDLIVGFYDMAGVLLKAAKVSDNTITYNKNGICAMQVSHEESKRMKGRVFMELTVTDSQHNIVDHSVDIVKMVGRPRNNNRLIDGRC